MLIKVFLKRLSVSIGLLPCLRTLCFRVLCFRVLSLGALCLGALSACSGDNNPKVKIAINAWPGYEFFFLAQEKGFLKEQNLNIELLELPALADVQRVYIQGRADGMASTMIEVVQAAGLTKEAISVILVTDYSNGGDVIVSTENIASVADLRGKRIGTEIGSLGMYILAQALAKEGLTLSDVDIINVEQLNAEQSITEQAVDAVVTYPPWSTNIMRHAGYHQIFDSSQIPQQVIDNISLRSDLLNSLPDDWLSRLHKAWDNALEYSKNHPEEAHSIMAAREGISAQEFSDALSGLKLLDSSQNAKVLASDQIATNAKQVCDVLEYAESIRFKCDDTLNLVQSAHNQNAKQ